MDFQSAMETFAEAWAAANTVKSEAPSDLSQSLSSELRRSKSPPRRSPEERAVPRPPSTPAHERATHAPHLSPKKEVFNNLLNKGVTGKTLPVHCVVEAVSSLEEGAWRRRTVVETDSYVIIPAATAFHELVPAAMMRLGYPHELAASAKGSVVINNWKPLPFERISEGPLATVGEVLGELTTVATLRIQLLRPRLTPLQDIKDKLLRLLLVQSRPLLMSTGCPLDEVTLAQICRGQDRSAGPHIFHEPTEETRRKFESWWSAQVSPRPPPFSPRRYPSPGLKRSPTLNTIPDHLHPALQTVQSQYPTQKTRMRTSFDPELELPKLQRWFSENQHPSRQQIQQYVRELNNLDSRRGRKPLDVNNVVYWFKNARAAQKRAELRNISGLSHLGMNGFNSRSHSPSNGSLLVGNENYSPHDHNILKSPMGQLSGSPGRYPMSVMSEDNLSNAGSDLEDDGVDMNTDNRPETPDAPLSLITIKKNNNENDKDDSFKESPKPPDIIKEHDIKEEPRDLTKSERLHSPQRSPAKNSDSSHNNNNNNEDENGHNDEQDLASDDEVNQERHYHPASPHLDRLPFPMVPNHPMFSHGIMYMSQYMSGFPGVSPIPGEGASGLNLALAGASEERRKRNRTFIDPVSEVPVLEQWFSMNTHPSHNLIIKYTEELNRMPYRQKFPRLESKNVQFWFKNRRAKCKRLKMSLYEPTSPGHYVHPGHPHAMAERKMV
ncbi:homeobox protein dve-1 [Pieris napi]|uniref:homeobox protein dve-1 n=1 Tax=Pieris napi TaxID=78633 RepID=UPI001FBB40F4|nr:homeobox protein dve-1 [Pieris napi]